MPEANIMQKTFVCAVCDQTFIEGWSEEEALQELALNRPDLDVKDCVHCCQNCYLLLQMIRAEEGTIH